MRQLVSALSPAPLSAVLVVGALTAPLAAQDVIEWIDGTKTERVRVSDFNTLEIKWSSSGSDKKPSDQVRELTVQKAREKFARGYAARDQKAGETAELFLGVAREELTKTPFLAQFGFWEAGRFLFDNGKEDEGIPIFDELITKLPDSGFVPRAYAMKIEYYLGSNKAKSADKVAKDYNSTALTKGYPDGYVRESELYMILAQAAGGALKAGELRSQLEVLVTRTESSYPTICSRARVYVANSLRQEGKLDEAMQLYSKITEQKALDKATLALAMLGTGHIHLARATESNKEGYREALMAFLHVYVDAQDAGQDVVAEALFFGAEAAKKWGGVDSNLIAARLRGNLRNDARFNGSEWAKK